MPIYEYQCAACGHHFDTIQKFCEEALIHCPVCGEPSLKKLISAAAFHLKGTGWYTTDFKNPTKPSLEGSQTKEKEKQEEGKKNINESDTKASTSETKKADKPD